jgi:hypothetical protein
MLEKLRETRTSVFYFYVVKDVHLIVSILNFVTGMRMKM